MASLVLAALAGLAGCLLGYRLGRRAAPLRATRDVHFGTRASLEAVDGWQPGAPRHELVSASNGDGAAKSVSVGLLRLTRTSLSR